MVRIGTVWDRTVEVIGGRTAMLGGIAMLTLFLPSVIRDAIAYAVAGSAAARPLLGALGLFAAIATLWGVLALTAVSSDPSTDRSTGLRLGAAALPSTILAVVVILIAFALLFVPGAILLDRAGFDFAAAARGLPQTPLSPGAMGAFALYALVYSVFLLWAAARLALLYPVLVNERRGLKSIARSFDLTRGLVWKIVGVLILYGIVLIVSLGAATTVAGLIFRLATGSGNPALVTFLAGIVGAVVTTIFAVLQTVFTAQLYVAARDARDGAAPRA